MPPSKGLNCLIRIGTVIVIGIIKPERIRKIRDPYINSVKGSHGPCALCGHYEKLTDDHIPPEGAGNSGRWRGLSYMTTLTGNHEEVGSRRYPSGIRFKTLCANCNNRLGGREDGALINFYDRVRKIVESPLLLSPIMRIPAKPNLIVRSLFAHMTAANEDGRPSLFDDEARAIFHNKRSLRLCSWNLFYWIYLGRDLFLARSLFHTIWSPTVELHEMFVLKMYPLAFLFIGTPFFHGAANLMKFIQSRDEEEAEIPLLLFQHESHPVWPAYTSSTNSIMFGGNAYGLVARPD
jgi:hypothetical protein